MAAWWKLWGCLGDPRSGTPRTPSICRPHRQLFDRAKAGPPEPTNLIRRDRQFKLLPARKQRLQGARRFDARELMTEAEMDSGAERHVPVRPPRQIELLGMFIRRSIHVGGDDHRHHPVALVQANSVKLDVLPHVARF